MKNHEKHVVPFLDKVQRYIQLLLGHSSISHIGHMIYQASPLLLRMLRKKISKLCS